MDDKLLRLIKRREQELTKYPDCRSCDSPKDFLELSDEEKVEVVTWIKSVFEPTKTVDVYSEYQDTTYQYKHMFEQSKLGFYTTNGSFKGALLVAGYIPAKKDVEKNAVNWRFGISKKSIRALKAD